MDRELHNIYEKVVGSSIEFELYLEQVFDNDVHDFLINLARHTEVFIFSGVIRNFFLYKDRDVRDLDIVLHPLNKPSEALIASYPHEHNSYGGYKLNIGGLNVDLWAYSDTWALKQNKVDELLMSVETLINTPFFNFSAIVYDLNYHQFVFNEDFLRFLKTKSMDLVLKENPLPELCLVNTIYYKQRYQLKVSSELQRYFIEEFPKIDAVRFDQIQKKHFGEVKYNYSYLKAYFNVFETSLLKLSKSRKANGKAQKRKRKE